MAGYDIANDKRNTATRSTKTGGDERSNVDRETNTKSTDDRSLFDRIWSGLFGGDMGDSTAASDDKKAPPVDKNYKEHYPQWSSYKSKAAEISGVAESYYDRLIGIESKGKPTATSSTGATGLPQWTSRTGKHYGLMTKADRQRTDEKGAIALGKFTRDNKSYLEKKLGRKPTQGELYLAHQQGPDGAAGLLANPDRRARDVVGFKAVNVNLPSGVSRNLTAREFAARWTSKFDGQQNIGGAPARARTANNDASLFGSSKGFWSMMTGSDDEAEIFDTVKSIQSGEIGIDPGELFSPPKQKDDTSVDFTVEETFGATDGGYTIDNMKTGAISNSVGVARNVGGSVGVYTNLGDPSTFNNIMSHIAGGDITGALDTAVGSVFKTVTGSSFLGGTLGLLTGGPLGGIFGSTFGSLFGIGSDNKSEQASSIFAIIQEYFLRIIIIILGLIFVAVGLSLFKNTQQIITQIKKVTK